jgi:hypothetical protein
MGKSDQQLHGPGSLKDGWNRLARDLERAIGLASLGPNETLIFQRAREGSWVIPSSRKKPEGAETNGAIPCRINLSALARTTERSRESLTRARRNLITARILVEHEIGGGHVTINKDYTTWLQVDGNGEPKGPLFTTNQLKDIWAGKQLTTVQPSCDRSVSTVQASCDRSVTPEQTSCDRSVTPPVTDQSHPPVTDQSQVHPQFAMQSGENHIEERAPALAELNSIQLIQFIESYKERAREARALAKFRARQERWNLREMKAEDSRIDKEFELPCLSARMFLDTLEREEREQKRRNNT